MTRIELVQYIVMALLMILGLWLQGFWGGFIVGAVFSALLFATIGRLLARKAASRINKGMRDTIINNY